MEKKVLRNLLVRYALTFFVVIGIASIPIISGIRNGMKMQNLIDFIIFFRWAIYIIIAAVIYGCACNIKMKRYEPLSAPRFLTKIYKEPQGADREIFIKSEELFQKSVVWLFSIVLAISLLNEVTYFLIKCRHGS